MNNKYQVIAKVKKLVIRHPPFDFAFHTILNTFEMNRETGVAEHLICVGESGTGKSTLKNEIEKTFPSYDDRDKLCIPVLVIDTPALPTVKNMAETVLVKLGDPLFFRGTTTEKTSRILNFLEKCEVKLMIIDELQHFIDQGNSSSPRQVSDWLKTIIDAAGVSTVLMGLERSEQILQINEQLRRRFSRRINLNAFSINTLEECAVFAGVLSKLVEYLDCSEKMDFTNNHLLKQIYFATNGIIDYMVKLFLGAYEVAIEKQTKIIDEHCLEIAFSRHIWVQGYGELNPFNPNFKWQKLNKERMPFHKGNPNILKKPK